MEYYAIARGKTSRELVPITRDVQELVDGDRDWYQSIFLYNEEHYKRFQATHSLAGINDVTTDRLIWDFDDKANVEKAREDAKELCQRLIGHGVPPEAIHAAFSGMKGFSIELHTDSRFTPEQFKNINVSLAEGLKTNDSCIHDAQRIMRVIGTKHDISGLFKLPLTLDQLMEVSADEIKMLATDMDNCSDFDWPQASLPESIVKMGEKQGSPLPVVVGDVVDLDFTRKPRGFSNCKYALLNGFFGTGERHNMLLVLAATCRALYYPKEVAYGICKSAARLQAQRNNAEVFPKEEIWQNIIEGVYGSAWKGGQFTCKTDAKLKVICDGLGRNKCKHTDSHDVVSLDEVFGLFKTYAENFEKNVIKTGIPSLDERVNFLVGTSNGVLAAPSVGKTSISLSILNHNSKLDVPSIFFSYDMYHSMIFLRLVQKHFGLSQDKIFHTLKTDKRKTEEIRNTIAKEYENVRFCFKSGQSAEDIDTTIAEAESDFGKKIKLAVVDYNELVSSQYSDPTQASAQVAQQLRQIANDRELCVITLLQPSKIYSNPSEEISSYQGAKGSGAIAQSLSLMLSLSRPGFSARDPENDRFFCVNALKNRNGPLFSVDLGWNGLRGSLHELSEEEHLELRELRDRKALEKSEHESY